jgi:hypothetical protein
MTHSLTGSAISRTVWYEMLSWIRFTASPPTDEGDQIVDHAPNMVDLETLEHDRLRQRMPLGDLAN